MLGRMIRTTISSLLLFALLLQVSPVDTIAIALDEKSISQSESQTIEDAFDPANNDSDCIDIFGTSQYAGAGGKITDDEIIGEIIEKRDESTKHFRLVDGTIVASIYDVPVHELNSNGEWVEIDNTLALSGNNMARTYSTNALSNTTAVSLAAYSAGNNTLTMQKDGHTISWGLNVNSRILTEATFQNALTEFESTKMSAKSVSGIVTYQDILPDVDISYQLIGKDVKENIILNSYTAAQSFSFALSSNGLSAELINNRVVLYDSSDNVVKVIEAPYMVDSADAISTDITISLAETTDGYTVTITPNIEWLLAQERVYPVIIDPTITDDLDITEIDNTSVNSKNPSSNEMYRYGCVYVGREESEYGNLRGVFKFTLPSNITESDMVIDAVIALAQRNYYGSGTVTVNAHKIEENLSLSSMTWNVLNGKYDTTILDTQIASSSTISTYLMWDITAAVKSWYLNGDNYGLALVSENEGGTYKYATFYTARYPGITTNGLPTAFITYINHDGLEDYLTYHYAGSDTMGSIAVGDFNGNLIYSYTDLAINSSYFPVTLQHVYNHSKRGTSAVVSSNSYYGNGVQLNLTQRIRATENEDIKDDYPYNYTDADGTVHYFKLKTGTTSVYEKEFDSNTILTKTSTGFTLTNGGDLTYTFSLSGLLLSIINRSNNKTMTLNYNGWKVIRITDGSGKITALAYDSNNYLTSITDPVGRKTTYDYSNGNLTKITKPDGTAIQFGYTYANGTYMLTSITDVDSSVVQISYCGNSPHRVKTLTEYGTNGTVGNILSWEYDPGKTTITDRWGKSETMMFDYTGHTICIRDSEGNAVYGRYTNSSDNNRHSLTYQSDLQRTVINHLQNHDFEDSTTSPWANYLSSATGTHSLDTTVKHSGNQSAKIVCTENSGRAGYYQVIEIPGSRGAALTLSAYVRIDSISHNGTATSGMDISILYQNNEGSWVMNSSAPVQETTGGEWIRITHSLVIPADAISDTVRACISFREATGTAYVDDVQFEYGAVANRYNLLDNGHFREAEGSTSIANWVGTHLNSSTDKVVTSDGRKGFSFTGSPTQGKYICQTVSVNGGIGDTYVFGAWAKADALPLKNRSTDGPRTFSIHIRFIKPDGTYQSGTFNFEAKSSEWQYLSGSISAESAYTRIEFYLTYNQQQNAVIFDDAQLYFERFGALMVYDDYGRISSVTDSEGNVTSYTYLSDTRQEISSITYSVDSSKTEDDLVTNYTYSGTTYKPFTIVDPNNRTTKYTYDSNWNLRYTSMTIGSSALYSDVSDYNADTGYLAKVTDPFNNITNYTYNTNKGTLTSVENPKGVATNYTYNANNDYLTGVAAADSTVAYTYSNAKLSTITHNTDDSNNVVYSFAYDEFGNTSSINVGTQPLISHTYAANNGLLTRSTYGNNAYYEPTYDSLDRIVSESYNGIEQFRYVYGADGNLGLHEDLVNGVTWRYEYTSEGKLTAVNGSNGVRLIYGYDQTSGELISCTVKDGSAERETRYVYVPVESSDDKKFVDYVVLPKGTVDYTYDDFYRASHSIKINDAAILETSYDYRDGAIDGRTSLVVETMTTTGNDWTSQLNYTYDANGNIETISEGTTLKATYHYDELDQLVREDNVWLNKTIAYTYDNGGNILSVAEYAYTTGSLDGLTATGSYSYVYGDANWKDKLTSYNGNAITYDDIGNPLTYYNGYTFTWEKGRQLAGISGNGNTISYEYNSDGIRTHKTVNGVTTNYILEGSNVVKETNGTDTLWFYYDATGSVVSFELNGTTYFYVKNLQGDIIAITDESGTKVVEYVYDSWGKLISITGSLASTVGVKNPYRYRGYRYDTETGLYYLQSRYYDPEIKRFINADGYISTGLGINGYNMFAYCGNNPVNRVDPTGQFWLTALIVTAAVVICTVALSGCSAQPTSDVGAAQPYVDMPGSSDPTSPNCYAYAIGSPVNEQPGGTSGCIPTNWNDVNDVGKSVEADLKAKGYTVREISGPDAKVYDNEFKIALRVGTQPYAYNPYTGQLYYDYHFMRQTNTGQWAEKHGYGGASVLWDAGMTPDTIPWTLGGEPYYDSDIIYYAVGK